ncbi:Shedu anti-phage system protein SduA domain-containing protein [uncultured Fibrobacter sp.]|uniref:Shedu anti-phage system protein SduA domain-containing protein n=1 Tax=uncultured Fibrobacter sp. TaxID=261512 RepID=UPI0025E24E7E|nr:Shedu anti-phage system protein SduA domain-containing protein [uncultured Fibrobacter sp.]
MIESQISKDYCQLLNEVEQGNKTENDIQNFLEIHSEFIPDNFLLNHGLHFKMAITKLQFGDYVCDFCTISKSTVEWNVNLIELEKPVKIYNALNPDVSPNTAFNKGLNQIQNWRTAIEKNDSILKNAIRPFLKPDSMADNRILVKYTLVIGRQKELDACGRNRDDFYARSTDSFKIMTFDSLQKHAEECSSPKNILSYSLRKVKVKQMNRKNLGSMLAHFHNEELSIDEAIKKKLRDDGYDIDAWENGELLVVNGKLPISKSDEICDAVGNCIHNTSALGN